MPANEVRQVIARNIARYRKSLRLSQERLAERAGVSRQSIINYEQAKTLPDSRTLSTVARALEVAMDDLLTNGLTLPTFRFRAHASFAPKAQFAAQMISLLEDYTALEQAAGVVPYTPESAPCYRLAGNEGHIREAASRFRRRLGLEEGPIPNLFEASEAIGLKILRKPVHVKGFFGLSAYSPDQGAFVLINNNATIERQIFTLAHEIGHLILHRADYKESLLPGRRDVEHEREAVAHYFASHLLVSENALKHALLIKRNILELKKYFRVSYTMVLKRLSDIGLLHYGDAIRQLSAEYHKQTGSPLTGDIELPPALSVEDFPENERFIGLIWRALELGKISEMRAAEQLNVTITDLRKSSQLAWSTAHI